MEQQRGKKVLDQLVLDYLRGSIVFHVKISYF